MTYLLITRKMIYKKFATEFRVYFAKSRETQNPFSGFSSLFSSMYNKHAA
jgi:hypothetical protein